MTSPTPPSTPLSTPPKVSKQTLRQRNEQKDDPNYYDVGGVPAQVISSGMRLAYTSKEYLETVDFGSMDGLRESVNALELLQMRRKAWLSSNCVDIPLVATYKNQPRAVRHRINLLLNSDTNKLFDDPVVPGREYTDTSPFDIKDEQRADAMFTKRLNEVYRSQPKLWRRIRAREFTIWPMHTTSHFVTTIMRMRRSDPYADLSTTYDEVAQFAVLEPAYNLQSIKRIHRRLRAILAKDGIKMPADAYRTPWYPRQFDDYSCGLRSYNMAKEFMERLTLIYTLLPSLGGAPPSESASSAGSAMDTDPDPDPSLGTEDPHRRINEPRFQRMLWDSPFNGYVNENAVREQMIGSVVCVALNRYDYQARAAIVAIDSVTDRDLMHDAELRREMAIKDAKKEGGKSTPPPPPPPVTAKVYAAGELRPQRTGKVQRFKAGQKSYNPVQNPGMSLDSALEGFANMTVSGSGTAAPKKGNFAGPQEAQQADGGKQRLTSGQWQRRNRSLWKQGRLRKAKRHDRYGPAFLNVPAFRKVLWEHANK
ncbi:hypothetical protein PG985_004305 [Apiospora marii]|uniref:uncharacterized protein n=1 Tax=Apiospora marii TaxID=335849 RepID=UPI003131FAFF